MKIGDRLYCIKNYISVGLIVNTQGKSYKIINIKTEEDDQHHIHVNTNYKNSGCSENEFIIGSESHYYNLYEYFVDIKELRKQKLKKIYGNK